MHRDATDSSVAGEPMTHGRHTALIAGYTGAVGGALARELTGRAEWRVYGLARRDGVRCALASDGRPAVLAH